MYNIFDECRQNVSLQISQQVKEFELVPANAYVEHKKYCQDLTESLLDPLCGVKVAWAPPGYGKSTYIRKVCNSLQHVQLSGALVMNASNFVMEKKSCVSWWNSELGIEPELYGSAGWYKHTSDLFEVKKPVAYRSVRSF